MVAYERSLITPSSRFDRYLRGDRGAMNEEELAGYAISQEIKTARFYALFDAAFPQTWKRARLDRLVQEERSHEAKLRAAYPGIK